MEDPKSRIATIPASWFACDGDRFLTEEQHARLREFELNREIREMYAEWQDEQELAALEKIWNEIPPQPVRPKRIIISRPKG